MQIIFRNAAHGEVIADEDESGGQFILRSDGTVWYRHEAAPEDLFANQTETLFRQAAAAFNDYTVSVQAAKDEAAELALVAQLKAALTLLGALNGGDNWLWPLIIEQAEHGML